MNSAVFVDDKVIYILYIDPYIQEAPMNNVQASVDMCAMVMKTCGDVSMIQSMHDFFRVSKLKDCLMNSIIGPWRW